MADIEKRLEQEIADRKSALEHEASSRRSSDSTNYMLGLLGLFGFLGQCNSASRSHTHSKYEVHGLSYVESDVNSLKSGVNDLESQLAGKASTSHTHSDRHTHINDYDIPGLRDLKSDVESLAEEVDREKKGVNILGFPEGSSWELRDVTLREDGGIEFFMDGVKAPRLLISAAAMDQLRALLNPTAQQGPEKGR